MFTIWITLVFVGSFVTIGINMVGIMKIHSKINYNYLQDQEDKRVIRRKRKTAILIFLLMIIVSFLSFLFNYLLIQGK